MRLKIQIPKSWVAQESPDGPATFCREKSRVPGPLQISWAVYKDGPVPNPSMQDMQDMAVGFGRKNGCGELLESRTGTCVFGRMGTAIFQTPEYPRTQIWLLSNGRDFITVTHICPEEPDPIEVQEAQEIVRTLTLGPDNPQ